jgi:hypothetical protein
MLHGTKGDQGRLQARLLHIYCHILHAGVEAADEAHTVERDLSDQGPASSGDGQLVG